MAGDVKSFIENRVLILLKVKLKRRKKMRKSLLFFLGLVVALSMVITFSFVSSAKEPTKVTVISCGTLGLETIFQDYTAKEWNRTHPDIKIKIEYVAWPDVYTKIRAYIAGGDPPDLAWVSEYGPHDFAKMGLIEPLDEWLKDEKDSFVESTFFEPGNCMYDGKWIVAPFVEVLLTTIVRTDLIEGLGIDPYGIKTFDDLVDAAKKATNSPVYGYNIALGDPNWVLVRAHDFLLNNGLESIVDFRPEKKAAYIQVLNFMSDLFPYISPVAPTWEVGGEITSWMQDGTAILSHGTYWPGIIAPERPDLGQDQIALIPGVIGPQIEESEAVLLNWFCGYIMLSDSKHKPEAAKVLRYLVSDETSNIFPMNLSAKKTPVEDKIKGLNEMSDLYGGNVGDTVGWWLLRAKECAEGRTVRPAVPYTPFAEINKKFQETILRMYHKEITPEQAYEIFKCAVEELEIK